MKIKKQIIKKSFIAKLQKFKKNRRFMIPIVLVF